jgi:hypothetical protein
MPITPGRAGSGSSRRLTARLSAHTGTSRIRPCSVEDLPRVAELRRRVFRLHRHLKETDLVEYFERVFFDNPWRDRALKPLIYEDDRGDVAGFIGVIPRHMLFGDSVIRVAVATQMMVAPESRGLAGRQLVRELLSGPQDLTISDTANDVARMIWKSVGGEDALLYGFEWERVLRPLLHARRQLASSPLLLRAAGFAARPLFAAIDIAASRITSTAIRQPVGSVEPLDASRIAAVAHSMLETTTLRPAFRADAFHWLLREAASKPDAGSLAGGMVRSPDGADVGWFVHCVEPGGLSQVLQLCARRGAAGLVMNHVLWDAWQREAVAVVGRLDAALLPVVEGPLFRCRRQPPWTLVHSRRPELLHAIRTGDVCLTRLDGEWWLRF